VSFHRIVNARRCAELSHHPAGVRAIDASRTPGGLNRRSRRPQVVTMSAKNQPHNSAPRPAGAKRQASWTNPAAAGVDSCTGLYSPAPSRTTTRRLPSDLTTCQRLKQK
jgi:hypothetical protein